MSLLIHDRQDDEQHDALWRGGFSDAIMTRKEEQK